MPRWREPHGIIENLPFQFSRGDHELGRGLADAHGSAGNPEHVGVRIGPLLLDHDVFVSQSRFRSDAVAESRFGVHPEIRAQSHDGEFPFAQHEAGELPACNPTPFVDRDKTEAMHSSVRQLPGARSMPFLIPTDRFFAQFDNFPQALPLGKSIFFLVFGHPIPIVALGSRHS